RHEHISEDEHGEKSASEETESRHCGSPVCSPVSHPGATSAELGRDGGNARPFAPRGLGRLRRGPMSVWRAMRSARCARSIQSHRKIAKNGSSPSVGWNQFERIRGRNKRVRERNKWYADTTSLSYSDASPPWIYFMSWIRTTQDGLRFNRRALHVSDICHSL